MPRDLIRPLREPEISQGANRAWKRFAGRLAVGWVLVVLGCLAAGWLVVDVVAETPVGTWDRDLPQQWEEARTSTMNGWTQLGSAAADTLFVVAVACFAGAALLFMKRWASALFLASALLVEVTIFSLTALIIGRDRPEVEQLDVSPPTSSFPSGHTAAATALYVGLTVIVWWNVKSKVAVAGCAVFATLAVVVVGLSRIYRGMHHPSDVLVGALLGLACVAVAYVAVRAWVGNDDADPAPEVEPDAKTLPTAEEIR